MILEYTCMDKLYYTHYLFYHALFSMSCGILSMFSIINTNDEYLYAFISICGEYDCIIS